MRKRNTTTKVINGIKRRTSRVFKLHPSSSPYISGDGFRSLADHVFDMDSTINPQTVQRGDIVFVQSSRIKRFFTKVHPRIDNPYVLITHNGDENINEEYVKFIDGKIIHWFAQNCLIKHERITPIPIGIENKWYYLHGIPKYFEKLKRRDVIKQNKIFYKFNVNTNKTERGVALSTLKKNQFAKTCADWNESFFYLSSLQNFFFVASPPGNGLDCIRTWEAMYLKVVPIVKRSVMTEYFYSLGLPLWIIDSWSELDCYGEKELCEKYETFKHGFENEALKLDYWIDEIINSKKND